MTMTNLELLQPLTDILSMAQQLSQLAKAEDWQHLETESEKYQQRVNCLHDENYLQAIFDANLNEDAKFIIMQIQLLNDDLDESATLMRNKIASELRHINQSNKALNAYGQ